MDYGQSSRQLLFDAAGQRWQHRDPSSGTPSHWRDRNPARKCQRDGHAAGGSDGAGGFAEMLN